MEKIILQNVESKILLPLKWSQISGFMIHHDDSMVSLIKRE